MRTFQSRLLSLALCAGISSANYTLLEDYGNSASFFDKFTFWGDADPAHGFVQYVDQTTAQNGGLISADDGSVYLGVDTSNVTTTGRQSVRITSKTAYNHGLVILDLNHMPGSICGTWPAFWMVGPNWPNGGEIDIIEGVNQNVHNAVALHTGEGCTVNNNGFLGRMQTSNCYVNAPGQNNNAGCGIQIGSAMAYGDGFNNAGGGVYATEWTSKGFKTWFFLADSVPDDIEAGTPDPSTWPTPDAAFAGNCDFDAHFRDMQIVFDITFCGDWAGGVWGSSGTCPSLAASCEAFVGNNPGAFESAYWEINSLKVYQSGNLTTRGYPYMRGGRGMRRLGY